MHPPISESLAMSCFQGERKPSAVPQETQSGARGEPKQPIPPQPGCLDKAPVAGGWTGPVGQ